MYVPFLGRISAFEWPVLLISFTLAWGEYLVTIITSLLPQSVIDGFTTLVSIIYEKANVQWLTGKRTSEFKYLSGDYDPREVNETSYKIMSKLMHAKNIDQMVQIFGYGIQHHVVRTKDDYLLDVHRITKPGSKTPRNGKVVYLHHGLLMSSEIWVTMIDKKLNIPFILYELGYDVWLGNNRGNKYCQKHVFLSTNSDKFWNFSLDEFALFDIPNVIDYILETTGKPKLTYIGFSQGSAQIFASVSVNNDLNDKIDQIIAISPATTPHGLYSKFLDIMVKATPNLIFLFFSTRILMPSINFWQSIMYPPFFNTSIDISNYMLFNWEAKNISQFQKLSSYAHLYSTTSVKTVVHWFQIMKNSRFQMYLDPNASIGGAFSPTTYPLRNITLPIHLIYGNYDSLVDIKVMKDQLPKDSTTSVEVDQHEHLDNIWGRDIESQVIVHVLTFLGHAPTANGSAPTKVIS